MCGLCFVIAKGSIKLQKSRILKTLSQRGPDAQGVFSHDNLHLFHTRLSITGDSKKYDQPILSKCRNYVLAFNGEIYNYKELAEAFNINETNSDTSLLFEGLIREGVSFVDYLDGMFSFVFMDLKKRSILVSRDQSGIKPLFIYEDENFLSFSSSCASFFKGLNVTPQLSKYSLYEFFSLGYNLKNDTIFKNTKTFPAGHIIKYNFNGRKVFDKKIDIYNLQYCKTDLDKIINQQIPVKKKTGFFLSGGIDSSFIFASAIKEKGKEFIALFGDSDTNYDEKNSATSLAKKRKVNLKIVKSSPEDIITSFYDFALTSFLPPIDPAVATQATLTSFLKKKGVKVVISGDGGDEIFVGYKRYKNIFIYQLVSKFKLRHFIRLMAKIMKFLGIRLLGSKIEKYGAHSLEECYFEMRKQDNMLTRHFREKNFLNLLRERFKNSIDCSDSKYFPIAHDQKYYLQNSNLMRSDTVTMMYGVECRVPLLAKYVVSPIGKKKYSIKNWNQKTIQKPQLSSKLGSLGIKAPRKRGFSLSFKDLKKAVKIILNPHMNRESIKLGLLVFYRENLSIENLESHELSRLLGYLIWIKMLEKECPNYQIY